jgi:hypothetical protein
MLFGVDDLNLPEEQMALSLTQLIIQGLRVPGEFMRQKGNSMAAAKE